MQHKPMHPASSRPMDPDATRQLLYSDRDEQTYMGTSTHYLSTQREHRMTPKMYVSWLLVECWVPFSFTGKCCIDSLSFLF